MEPKTQQGVNPWIEVDGGVGPNNAYKVIEAGANALVAGSAVFGAKDYAEAIKGIKTSTRPMAVHGQEAGLCTLLRGVVTYKYRGDR
ncbi:hypothetical protein L6452_39510 [Arctium lappa]|uniref:Uncharacterized protein n=1 Tax=Arctium lappa TaxID=4217 RepID=A0ACB8XT03_ARCLA|nr:hypothetical protein L6452_39510 [Arctium lappa]